jgi:hypothetical protein
MVQMPMYAPIVILLFLGTCGGLLLMGVAFVYGLISRKHVVARVAAALILVGALLYGGSLLGFALTSSERTLPAGEHKYFCEVDCHIAYSVMGLTPEPALAGGSEHTHAGESLYVVRLQTWFDPETISPHRGDGYLTPSPLRISIVDDAGREYAPVDPTQFQYRLPATIQATPLSTPLRPGESFSTDIVFDLPVGIRNPRLLVTDSDWTYSLLIGHEKSPLHKKIYFDLTQAASSGHSIGARKSP